MKQMVKNWKSLQSLGKMVKGDAENNVVEINSDLKLSSLSDGTLDKVLGLDSAGKLVKGVVGGGTKLYMHTICLSQSSSYPSNEAYIYLTTILDTPFTFDTLTSFLGSSGDNAKKIVSLRVRKNQDQNAKLLTISNGLGVRYDIRNQDNSYSTTSSEYTLMYGSDDVREL